MEKVNLVSLIEKVSNKTGESKRTVSDIINCCFDEIVEIAKRGDKLVIAGFGSFEGRIRKGRIGVNPLNPSEKIEIPSVFVPKFKAGYQFKHALKHKDETIIK
jgi:DNA-binding protein HU-beta